VTAYGARVAVLQFDDWARQLYLAEAALQCTFVQRAYALVESNISDERGADHAGLAFAMHAFLAAAANLSKLLFPSLEKRRRDSAESVAFRKVRGESLRELLEVTPTSPLASRSVRNFFEHMDEYLDRWLIDQPRLTVDQVEGGTQPPPPTSPRPPLREMHPGRREVRFYGETVDLAAVAREVDRIRQRIVDLQPGEYISDPVLWTLLTMLPPFPPELRLSAPTRRPDESVMAGVPERSGPSFEETIEQAFRLAKEALEHPPLDE
jgi:hypothetical protein